MKLYRGVVLAVLVLYLIVLVCYAAEESKVGDADPTKVNTETNTLPKTSDDKQKTGENNNVVGTKKDVPSTDTKVLETKVVPKVGSDKDKEKLNDKPKDADRGSDKTVVKDGEGNKGKVGGSESKTLPKGGATKENVDPLKPPKKEGVRGEECGSSNNCVDDKNKLVACLRVPGNDSPELSLLIQYGGTTALTAEISAPDSVHLERKSVQFQDKGNQKVKVSLGKDNKNTIIVLTAKGSNCSIDFSDLIQRNSAEKPKAKAKAQATTTTTKPSFLEIVTNNPYLVIIISIGIIIPVGAIPICIIRRRKQQQLTSYQKLETELPVSVTGGKKETDEEEGGGWDDSWGDSWDDEEAPKTPSLPITPSLSSKGLASRKITKDSWKD
ncbi:hypothetical protein ACHQM5_011844 [Ranunculus cassubicifolius]